MKTIAIGGEILCNEKIDGIHRYMLEILRRVDKRLEGSDMKIVVYIRKGETIKHIRFSNIVVDEVDAPSSLFHFRFVPKYVKRLGAIDCNMSNNVTVCKGSIATICDLIPLSKLSGFSFKNKCKFRILYKLVSRYAGTVVTLTQHIGDSLVEKIKTDPKKIVISGCGWDHMKDIDEDEKIFERYPEIKKGQYYYAMGNQFPYKNFAWVTNNALRNPGCMYVIAGNVPPGFKSPEKFPNVIYVGYISDGEHKSLLKKAKAFIHPSRLEGFGIPPMEALCLGVPAVVADASCLPEVYGDYVYYINPDDADVDMEELTKQPLPSPEPLLEKYTWDHVADIWMEVFEKAAAD